MDCTITTCHESASSETKHSPKFAGGRGDDGGGGSSLLRRIPPPLPVKRCAAVAPFRPDLDGRASGGPTLPRHGPSPPPLNQQLRFRPRFFPRILASFRLVASDQRFGHFGLRGDATSINFRYKEDVKVILLAHNVGI